MWPGPPSPLSPGGGRHLGCACGAQAGRPHSGLPLQDTVLGACPPEASPPACPPGLPGHGRRAEAWDPVAWELQALKEELQAAVGARRAAWAARVRAQGHVGFTGVHRSLAGVLRGQTPNGEEGCRVGPHLAPRASVLQPHPRGLLTCWWAGRGSTPSVWNCGRGSPQSSVWLEGLPS